jgi:hypothetical protein
VWPGGMLLHILLGGEKRSEKSEKALKSAAKVGGVVRTKVACV